MPRSIRFAVVGAKGYSRTHLAYVQFLQQQGRGQLVASVMIDKQDHPDLVAELSAENVRIFTDYRKMLDACRDQVDMVTLPVPIYYHAPMTIAALSAGYHVLVEKPVAGTLPQVDEMIAARDQNERVCAVGFQQIYSAVFQKLKKYVIDGTLGQVKRMAIMALWPRNPAYYARNNWAGKLFCNNRPVYDSPFNRMSACDDRQWSLARICIDPRLPGDPSPHSDTGSGKGPRRMDIRAGRARLVQNGRSRNHCHKEPSSPYDGEYRRCSHRHTVKTALHPRDRSNACRLYPGRPSYRRNPPGPQKARLHRCRGPAFDRRHTGGHRANLRDRQALFGTKRTLYPPLNTIERRQKEDR